MGQKKTKLKHEQAETGIPLRYCRYGSKQPQESKYCNEMSYTIFLVYQCLEKLCLHYNMVYQMCNSIMSKKTMNIPYKIQNNTKI